MGGGDKVYPSCITNHTQQIIQTHIQQFSTAEYILVSRSIHSIPSEDSNEEGSTDPSASDGGRDDITHTHTHTNSQSDHEEGGVGGCNGKDKFTQSEEGGRRRPTAHAFQVPIVVVGVRGIPRGALVSLFTFFAQS